MEQLKDTPMDSRNSHYDLQSLNSSRASGTDSIEDTIPLADVLTRALEEADEQEVS